MYLIYENDKTKINIRQLLDILFNDNTTKARYPFCYILLNSKLFQSYLIALNSFKTKISKYNIIKLNIESITLDYEIGLISTVTKIFPKVSIIKS